MQVRGLKFKLYTDQTDNFYEVYVEPHMLLKLNTPFRVVGIKKKNQNMV